MFNKTSIKLNILTIKQKYIGKYVELRTYQHPCNTLKWTNKLYS